MKSFSFRSLNPCGHLKTAGHVVRCEKCHITPQCFYRPPYSPSLNHVQMISTQQPPTLPHTSNRFDVIQYSVSLREASEYPRSMIQWVIAKLFFNYLSVEIALINCFKQTHKHTSCLWLQICGCSRPIVLLLGETTLYLLSRCCHVSLWLEQLFNSDETGAVSGWGCIYSSPYPLI